MGMLDVLKSTDSMILENGMDARNYGQLEGIPEARRLFAEVMGIDEDEVFIGGNSSLNMMYDAVSRAMVFGFPGSEKPWGQQKKIRFLCPVPGYDRHFGICEVFGIQMINVPMTPDGPDMTLVESWVNNDETVKRHLVCSPVLQPRRDHLFGRDGQTVCQPQTRRQRL